MTGGRFSHRVQAAPLVQEVQRLTSHYGVIDSEGSYYVVLLLERGKERRPIATFRSWADWEAWKLAHPDLVLGQLSFLPPSE